MGELKATLPLGAGTVLEQCLELFRACGIEDLVVVTGHGREKIDPIALRSGARTVHNPEFRSGMYSSIRTGVRHISDQSSGFFLLPVDIPLVRPATVMRLMRSFAAAPFRITYPTFKGERGHPPLIARDVIPAIVQNEHPRGGLRSLLGEVEIQWPNQVVDLNVADSTILFDMDTPEDYAFGCKQFVRRDLPSMEECTAILEIHPMPVKGLVHGRLVANIAVALCEAIARQGQRKLDLELCRVCGRLHDIAKGHRNHEQTGARWLQELGFGRAAEIIAAHKDIDWLPGAIITEKEIVHLADKMARGSRIVTITERFEEKLALFKDNPEAVQAIQRRYKTALEIGVAVELEAGRQLDKILSHFLFS